ncbi:MAG TPA: DUF1573 domain-containing protein [Candidatus Paceibacterota bacterium]|nr:DUF1573 domain-containing protein [Candidatus Paceibacterota bacterium]
MKIFISLVIVAAFLFGLAYLSARQTEEENIPSAQASALVAEKTSFDFGTISMAKGKVSYNYKLKNSSGQEVEITKLYTSCMCTEASLLVGAKRFGPFGMPGHGFGSNIKQTLVPGEEVNIEAVFDPAAHGPAGVGTISRVITVEEKAGGQIDLTFSATVTP